MIYHKGATQLDQCAHRLMEFNLSPDWHGSTIVGDYIAYYHEEKLFTVRHLKKGISCLVYARSPYDAIEKVRAMEGPVPPHGDLVEKIIIEKAIKDSCAECKDACIEFDGFFADCDQCILQGVKKALIDTPTIIPAGHEEEKMK